MTQSQIAFASGQIAYFQVVVNSSVTIQSVSFNSISVTDQGSLQTTSLLNSGEAMASGNSTSITVYSQSTPNVAGFSFIPTVATSGARSSHLLLRPQSLSLFP